MSLAYTLRSSVSVWDEFLAWVILCFDSGREAEVRSGCSRKEPIVGLRWSCLMLLPSLSLWMKRRESLCHKDPEEFCWGQEPGHGDDKTEAQDRRVLPWSQEFHDFPFFVLGIPGSIAACFGQTSQKLSRR